jgi:hypothetical protein
MLSQPGRGQRPRLERGRLPVPVDLLWIRRFGVHHRRGEQAGAQLDSLVVSARESMRARLRKLTTKQPIPVARCGPPRWP